MNKIKRTWELFQVNPERTAGFTIFFNTYEELLSGIMFGWEHEANLREWEDIDDQ